MPFEIKISDHTLNITLAGDFVSFDAQKEKSTLSADISKREVKEISINGENLKQWDSSLLVILFDVTKWAKKEKKKIQFKSIPSELERLLDLAFKVNRNPEKNFGSKYGFVATVGDWGIRTTASFFKGTRFMGKTFRSFLRFLSGRAVMRRVDFLFALQESGPKALAIVSLISFMVGLILAFVGAIQLKMFGAQIYVASLVAIAMTRIIGAMMAGIIMAGRTGSSYAATIGTMQVNEELDALKTMGIPQTDFLVLPRLMALTLMMPILTLVADVMGILGGAFVGLSMLGISAEEYWRFTYNALAMKNFWVGIFHGFVYGIVISLCGCYYGVYCGRDADSVGVATTKAVVSSIVWMVLVTGVITWISEMIGI